MFGQSLTGVNDPEVLLLKDLTYENGLPLKKKEIEMHWKFYEYKYLDILFLIHKILFTETTW